MPSSPYLTVLVFLEATHEASPGPLKGVEPAQKALQRSEMETSCWEEQRVEYRFPVEGSQVINAKIV